MHMACLKASRAKIKMLRYGGKPLTVHMTAYAALGIRPEGYGHSNKPKDCPIVLADMPSGLTLYVWADPRQDAPTHAINLEETRIRKDKSCIH